MFLLPHSIKVSHMLPRVFKEEQLRVYSTKTEKEACLLVRRYSEKTHCVQGLT